MFSSLLSTPLTLMTLTAQAHSVLNSAMMDEVVKCMNDNDWTCHKCSVKVHGMMEIDHLKGHKVSGKNGIMPICQFCHDRQHLLWAAARKRLTIMHAPDLDYLEISQLTWSLVGHHGRDGFSIDRNKLSRDLSARREDAFEAMGHDNIEAIFEAIFTMSDRLGEEEIKERLVEFDKHIKIVPSALLDEDTEIKSWSVGGFRPAGEEWRDNAIPNKFAGYEALRKAGDTLKSRI
jgi:hypothetical protein